ncbi:MAG: glycoside hydrolase family 2 TIM barrel-domain containing protein [Eubacteriales bacterium]
MFKTLGQRVLSVSLVGAILLSSMTIVPSVIAGGQTVEGESETVKVSSTSSRENNFNEGWKFYLGTSSTAQNVNFDDSSWKAVTLPHDFSISQSYTTSGEAESGFLPGGTGWYRKTFTLPESDAGKTVLLYFDGVYSDAYVYVNGTLVGEHHYGYTSFAFDISDYLTCDGSTENVIAVKAVNTIPSSRWYSGSGIYRDVTLIVTDPVHVDLNGTYVTTPNISSGNGTVTVAVDVVNDGDSSASVTVTNTVVETGDSAVTTVTVDAGTTVTATARPVVSSPKLWSPDSPNLYTVRTVLTVNGEEVDSYDTTFGFRWFSFDSTGFHLNGKNVKLNGVCLHHDQGALGSAAYYDAIYRQLSIMKDMGVNAVRTSHNPADEDFIDICNELGLLVVEEAFDGWSVAKNGNSYDFAQYFSTNLSSSNGIYGGSSSMTWSEFAIKSMVKRDRNAPSIILWSLGNEIQEGASAASTFPTIAQDLIDWVNEVDTTRPTTIGDNTKSTSTSSVLGQVLNVIQNNGGVVGFNYANDASTLYSLAQSYGGVCIAMETSSAINSRGIYTSQESATNADGKYHLTSYDTSAVSWGITAHESIYNTYQYDCVAGEFVWTGFDYIGEPTPWNGTGSGSVSGSGAYPNSSYFGIVETTGFEKDTYYLYRSQWNQDETTLHLVTAWDSDNYMTTSSKTPVVIYSNAPVVKLYRNGTLIGTATRTANTSSAGHTYYTYSTASDDSSVCTAVSGSGSTSLYATFNVTYASGTISAKAFEADGTTEITLSGNSGKNSVSTPGTVSKLVVSQNKTEIAADGSSLVFITVDVTDANGVLDTTATNTINFSLTGNGVILGVDNGDQATTAKYQQSSVLTSETSANIAAYAGKALVIVRSTKDAGSFTVNVTSSGLTGGSATVTTTAVDDGTVTEGLVSYTMVRDYTVKAGTVPTLNTTATGTMADDSIVSGTIVWNEISEETYNTAGDYTIEGTLTFDELEPISVTCRLHVIDNVIALRNISTVTTPDTVPTLSTVVNGVLPDGTLSGEFTVTWDAMTENQFATVGDVVTVNGTATIFGDETLPVTCTVRVGEAVNTESTNVASAASLSEDCTSTSDNLSSIVDGVTNNSSDTNARWTNYNNRNTSSTAAITFTWATAQLISSVNLYYFTDSYSASLPSAVKFEYSLNGSSFTEIGYADVTPSAGFTKTEYTFDQVINPVALRVTFTEQSGHCVGLTEAEVMTFAGTLEYNSSADLSGITVDGTAIDGFVADTLTYEAEGSTVAATTDVNAGITILPVLDNVVRILTVSEDGSTVKTYEVTLANTPVCAHEHTEIRNAKEETCTEDGYTGDTYCTDCGALIASGTVSFATGHTTTLQNAKEATCTEAGYTGDEVCSVCGETVKTGSTIAAKGHSWDSGVVTKEATEEEEGIMTYTCSVCGETRTEAIPKVTPATIKPSVSVSAARAASGTKITLTGKFEDYENISKYHTVTAHGLVYYRASKLGTRILTVNTPGRTKVSFSTYKADGSFSYTMTPAYASTKYVVRAYLAYTDDAGRTVYVYSDPIVVSYNTLT